MSPAAAFARTWSALRLPAIARGHARLVHVPRERELGEGDAEPARRSGAGLDHARGARRGSLGRERSPSSSPPRQSPSAKTRLGGDGAGEQPDGERAVAHHAGAVLAAPADQLAVLERRASRTPAAASRRGGAPRSARSAPGRSSRRRSQPDLARRPAARPWRPTCPRPGRPLVGPVELVEVDARRCRGAPSEASQAGRDLLRAEAASPRARARPWWRSGRRRGARRRPGPRAARETPSP